eukprot:CAMPEP_0118973628 /NCGR_PEP_ID=MMETSP1173-20130426/10602_1 /TAXON_ID=1034831 /ORGANISM="Rhizochromulina marina cf, Strain CCMP1243" /LENGTH=54 /DNA_ID=CAMNT_0006923311 /DNA_START=188 /DNA_END=352 /DNA_ORIENTATION=+
MAVAWLQRLAGVQQVRDNLGAKRGRCACRGQSDGRVGLGSWRGGQPLIGAAGSA